MNFKPFLLTLLTLTTSASMHALSVAEVWEQTKDMCSKTYNVITQKYPATSTCALASAACALLCYKAAQANNDLDTFGRAHLQNYDGLMAQAYQAAHEQERALKWASWDCEDFWIPVNQAEVFQKNCVDANAAASYKLLWSLSERWGFVRAISLMAAVFAVPFMVNELTTDQEQQEESLVAQQ